MELVFLIPPFQSPDEIHHLGLMPMVFFLSATLSTDALLNAVSLLFVGIILKF